MSGKRIHESAHRFLFNLESGLQLKVGSVLVAQPFWMQDIYRHAVILLTDYDTNGCSGIIINKMSTVHLNQILPGARVRAPLYYGGPDELTKCSYVHNIPAIPEADYFGNGIYFGGDPVSLEEMIKDKRIDFRKIKFCAGTVQWSPGQLESEIADSKWWLTQITARQIFSLAPAHLWSFILTHSSHLYGIFAADTADPSLN